MRWLTEPAFNHQWPDRYTVLVLSQQNSTHGAESSQIREVAASVGEQVDDDVSEALASFSNLFLKWNAKINLSAIRSPAELIARHLLDAFAARRFVRENDRIIDVGSGGGLPAIPLALLHPSAQVELFEPIAKKVAFLRTAVRELGLTGRVRVNPRRIDEIALAANDTLFDVAMSRATFAPFDWLSIGRRLIRRGGLVLVFATTEAPQNGERPDRTFSYSEDRHLWAFGCST
jgi:16S rRNA (guanine527-N7)-methyltransferase